MKNLSLFTFSLFLVLLGFRLFSLQSKRFDRFGNVSQTASKSKQKKSVFDMEPEKARALLNDLDFYFERKKKVANAETQPKEEKSIDIAGIKKTIEKKYRELDEALVAQEDNLIDIKYIQDEIKKIKKDGELEYRNSEIWSAEFILMLMMQEQFTLNEVNELSGPEELGLSMEDWVRMKETAQTDEFKQKIYAFKGVNLNVQEGQEITQNNELETGVSPFQQSERNDALSDFQQRNFRDRNGENSDTEVLQAELYNENESNNEYMEGSREPASGDEIIYEESYNGNTEEKETEYQNYNDGYEDEY